MGDYISTAFNLLVGLLDKNKIIWIAIVGLLLVVIWQLISLLTNSHSVLARKCRRISKFLYTKGLSASNYNAFLALVAKMPQEFIRGYKTFEHASYGLPSDYIKRFDSIDVETNGGMFNHGKSFVKAFIYAYTILLSLFSVALMGADNPITGAALAEAMFIPVLFLILAKAIYYIFMAIRQQQYKVVVDEFNEMLDIMNEKIENNDNMPGIDILAYNPEQEETQQKTEDVSLVSQDNVVYQDELDKELDSQVEYVDGKQFEELEPEQKPQDDKIENAVVFEEKTEPKEKSETEKTERPAVQTESEKKARKPKQTKRVKLAKQGDDDLETEQKRGRGRPKKVPEGELVITNDKQFAEALERAEKLMRKSQEALSASQSKRVEKALKELVDAMTLYKEQQQ